MAVEGVPRMTYEHPERAEFLVLVSMNKQGEPLLAQDIRELLQSA
jgi:hypothetical protein